MNVTRGVMYTTRAVMYMTRGVMYMTATYAWPLSDANPTQTKHQTATIAYVDVGTKRVVRQPVW